MDISKSSSLQTPLTIKKSKDLIDKTGEIKEENSINLSNYDE